MGAHARRREERAEIQTELRFNREGLGGISRAWALAWRCVCCSSCRAGKQRARLRNRRRRRRRRGRPAARDQGEAALQHGGGYMEQHTYEHARVEMRRLNRASLTQSAADGLKYETRHHGSNAPATVVRGVTHKQTIKVIFVSASHLLQSSQHSRMLYLRGKGRESRGGEEWGGSGRGLAQREEGGVDLKAWDHGKKQ
jgi:hypothetical protein